MEMKDVFPERLRALRSAIGISQHDFAEIIGITRPTLSYYENGSRTPDIDVLARIHERTSCSMAYLLGFSESMSDEFADVAKRTGLTDKSLNNLDHMSKSVINFLLSNDAFLKIVEIFDLYAKSDLYKDPEFHDTGREYTQYIATKKLARLLDEYSKSSEVDREYFASNRRRRNEIRNDLLIEGKLLDSQLREAITFTEDAESTKQQERESERFRYFATIGNEKLKNFYYVNTHAPVEMNPYEMPD